MPAPKWKGLASTTANSFDKFVEGDARWADHFQREYDRKRADVEDLYLEIKERGETRSKKGPAAQQGERAMTKVKLPKPTQKANPRPGKQYPGVHGKVVDWAEHIFEEGMRKRPVA
jgi:hypothetical protein